MCWYLPSAACHPMPPLQSPVLGLRRLDVRRVTLLILFTSGRRIQRLSGAGVGHPSQDLLLYRQLNSSTLWASSVTHKLGSLMRQSATKAPDSFPIDGTLKLLTTTEFGQDVLVRCPYYGFESQQLPPKSQTLASHSRSRDNKHSNCMPTARHKRTESQRPQLLVRGDTGPLN